MLDFMLAGGFVVVIAGVLQAASRRKSRYASNESLLREGMAGFEGPDAEAFRAEFRGAGSPCRSVSARPDSSEPSDGNGRGEPHSRLAPSLPGLGAELPRAGATAAQRGWVVRFR
jgi:hypothetical protein